MTGRDAEQVSGGASHQVRTDVQSGMAVAPLTRQASTLSLGPARASTRRRITACSGLRGSEVLADGAAGEMLAEEPRQE